MLRKHLAQPEGRRTVAVYLPRLVKDRWIWYAIAFAFEIFFGFPVGVRAGSRLELQHTEGWSCRG
jgi:hypothetical protein